MSNFKETFNYLLEIDNLTLRALSEKIDVSSFQLSKYANGYFEPSLKNALILSKFFNCSLDFLFGIDEIEKRYEIKQDANVDLFLKRLFELIDLRKTNINRIAKNLSINRTNFYHWQNAKVFPKAGIIAKLAIELKTNMEYLIGRTDYMEYNYEF